MKPASAIRMLFFSYFPRRFWRKAKKLLLGLASISGGVETLYVTKKSAASSAMGSTHMSKNGAANLLGKRIVMDASVGSGDPVYEC